MPGFLGDVVVGRFPGKISVEGSEVNLPATTAIPLGFIASELITNAAKFGKGRIVIKLESDLKHGCALRWPMMARRYRRGSTRTQAKGWE